MSGGGRSKGHSLAPVGPASTLSCNAKPAFSPAPARARLFDQLEAMGAEALQGALVALDEVSRPLTAREIEHALRDHGVPRSRAVLFGASLRKLNIVAVVGGEQ